MDKIGLLDEQFSPGHYEDDDYCYRTRLAGYKLTIAGDAHVHHHGSASFKLHAPEQLAELPKINYQKFINKWGVAPREFIKQVLEAKHTGYARLLCLESVRY